MTTPLTEVYLGDFLHGSFDGTYVILRAPTSVGGENMVHLEPEVMAQFQRWIIALTAEYPEMKTRWGMES